VAVGDELQKAVVNQYTVAVLLLITQDAILKYLDGKLSSRFFLGQHLEAVHPSFPE